MAQHFLLSSKAKTISSYDIAEMSNDEATKIFEELRWSDTNGKAVCPTCGCTHSYIINTTSHRGKPIKRYKCSACKKQYTVTTGTIFADHKLPLKKYLYALVTYIDAVKGISALQLSRNCRIQYKTAYVLLHKFRAIIKEHSDNEKLKGTVEMDGCYVGKTKPKNRKEDRLDLRLAQNANPNKRCVMVAREVSSDGSGAVATRVGITKGEYSNVISKFALDNVEKNSTIHSDGAPAYENLMAYYELIQGDHSKAYVGENGESSNQAESFFSRFRRLQYGQCHKITVKYLLNYSLEIAYREDNRRRSNGSIMVDLVSKAMNTSNYNPWVGYWSGNRPASEQLLTA